MLSFQTPSLKTTSHDYLTVMERKKDFGRQLKRPTFEGTAEHTHRKRNLIIQSLNRYAICTLELHIHLSWPRDTSGLEKKKKEISSELLKVTFVPYIAKSP